MREKEGGIKGTIKKSTSIAWEKREKLLADWAERGKSLGKTA